jgi:hypothetical protein
MSFIITVIQEHTNSPRQPSRRNPYSMFRLYSEQLLPFLARHLACR